MFLWRRRFGGTSESLRVTRSIKQFRRDSLPPQSIAAVHLQSSTPYFVTKVRLSLDPHAESGYADA